LPKLTDISGEGDDLQEKLDKTMPRNMPAYIRNFVKELANGGMLNQLPSIVQSIEEYGTGGPQPIGAEIISAVPLTDDQRNRISTDLQQRYESQLDLQFSVDESLIGGLIIRVGDEVVDNSLRTRLGIVQRSMLAS